MYCLPGIMHGQFPHMRPPSPAKYPDGTEKAMAGCLPHFQQFLQSITCRFRHFPETLKPFIGQQYREPPARREQTVDGAQERGIVQRSGVHGGIPAVVRTFKIVFVKGRVGDDEGIRFCGRIGLHILVQGMQAAGPGRAFEIMCCLPESSLIQFQRVYYGSALLCKHKAEQPGTGANVEDARFLLYKGGGESALYAGVRTYFHGAARLLYGELFEPEIAVAHVS